MRKRLLLLPLLLFLFYKGNAQSINDTVLLLNGDIIYTSVLDTTKGVVRCRDDKNKSFILDNDRIFSIRNSRGEVLYYKQDSLAGYEFTVDEMRYYIKGEQDAQRAFKPIGSVISNAVLGGFCGLTGFFLCPIPPFMFSALTGVTKVKIKKSTVSNLEYLNHETYLMGYEVVARSKRKIRSLISGGAGVVAGLGVFAVLKNNNWEIFK